MRYPAISAEFEQDVIERIHFEFTWDFVQKLYNKCCFMSSVNYLNAIVNGQVCIHYHGRVPLDLQNFRFDYPNN